MKEIFASLCERIICVLFRSQHSLDILHISRSGTERGSLFLVTFLSLHRDKKVMWPFAINLNKKKPIYITMYVLDCSRINLLANDGIVIEGYIYINFMEFFGSYR